MANGQTRRLLEQRANVRGTRVTSVNKHQQRTQETRRKLLKAARRIFTRDGFEAARIEDIAAEAGHTRGAFYANFEAKEDLFFALLEREIVVRRRELAQVIEGLSTREQRLTALRDHYVGKLRDRQWMMLTLEFKLFALRHGKLRARLADAHRRIRSSITADLMADLVPERERDSHAEEVCKSVLEAALSGMAVEHAYDPKRLNEKEAMTALAKIFDTFLMNSQTNSAPTRAPSQTATATAPGSGTPRERSPR